MYLTNVFIFVLVMQRNLKVLERHSGIKYLNNNYVMFNGRIKYSVSVSIEMLVL